MKGVIFTGGDYPLGSSAQRIRMWHYGLFANEIEADIIIADYAPSEQDKRNSENFVHFMLNTKREKKTENKIKLSLINVYQRVLGLYKSHRFLKQNYQKVNFVFQYGVGFLEGLMIHRFCKKNGILYLVERTDENRRLFSEKKSILGEIAILNDLFFDKYILKKADALFVISKYLEEKYKKTHPSLYLIRSAPSFTNIERFIEQQKRDIHNLDKPGINVFFNGKIKIVFAGSCVYTNGLKFFLECAAKLIKKEYEFDIVFIFFKGLINEIVDFAEQLKITKNITIIENVYTDYIPAIYKYSDILVLPEMGITVANAGFPGKTAEYLASGRAIISTDFSDLSDYLINGYNALISPIGDYDLYTNNLENLISNPELRTHLGKNAIITAKERFDYIQNVKPLIAVVKEKSLSI